MAFYKDHCHESYDCVSVCPEGAITKNDFRVDRLLCTNCGACVDACAFEALRMIGKQTSPQELLDQILLDLAYYKKNNGGITFTGGEPLLYSKFMESFLDLCDQNQLIQKQGLHKNIETAGLFDYQKKIGLLKRFDLIYFDLKIMDTKLHKKATGVDNQIILKNARQLIKDKLPVEFRIPLVPGYTDDPNNLHQLIEFLKELQQNKVHLLKYHNMGESKIAIINGAQPRLGLDNYDLDKFSSIKSVFTGSGLQVICQ